MRRRPGCRTGFLGDGEDGCGTLSKNGKVRRENKFEKEGNEIRSLMSESRSWWAVHVRCSPEVG